jgi:hypothetical protein
MQELGVKPEAGDLRHRPPGSVLRLRVRGLLDDEPLQFSIVLGVARRDGRHRRQTS